MKIGIIAEDDSDVEVLRELSLKFLRPRKASFKKFVGNGCGKLRRKCGAWASNLVQQGCQGLIVAHDLDSYDELELSGLLRTAIAPARAKVSVVLIPKREIEAWLLYDRDAIAKAFKANKNPKLPGNPETIADPKKYLRDLVYRTYAKTYLNTIHNLEIAKNIDPVTLRSCRSFAPHLVFIRDAKAYL